LNLWSNESRRRRSLKRAARETGLEQVDDAERTAEADESGVAEAGLMASDPLAEALALEQVQRLREAMGALPPEMRRCVMLRVDQGLKYEEIAAALRIPVGTVKSRLSQARTRLKQQLARYFPDLDFDERA